MGYLEPDVEVLGCVIPRHGVLVVHDPPRESNPLPKVPGILGNIIKACYQEVICQSGSKLVDLSAVVESSGLWLPDFQFCHWADVDDTPIRLTS